MRKLISRAASFGAELGTLVLGGVAMGGRAR